MNENMSKYKKDNRYGSILKVLSSIKFFNYLSAKGFFMKYTSLKYYLVFLMGILFLAEVFGQDSINVKVNNFPYQIPRLSPVPSAVEGIKNCSLSLNGEWNFDIQNRQKGIIQVPGEWEMQGYFVKEGETATYSKSFSIPEDWTGKRVKIRFDAVSSHAIIKVNGKLVGEHEGSFVPFEFDITDKLISKGKNTLEVDVQAFTISDRMSALSQYASHTIGGLLRKVSLFALPEVNVSDVFVITTFDSKFKNAKLHLTTKITNESQYSASTHINYILKDAEGKVILNKKVVGNKLSIGKEGEMTNIFAIRKPKHWNPEHPYLYDLTTQILVNNQKVQELSGKIGFRQVKVEGNQLFVNGEPVKLHGVNRHEVHPLKGRSLSPELCRKDAEMFKEANCNYIRTSHYPPSVEFLNAADELGLFVESEANLNWIQHHASPIWRKWDYQDIKYLPFMIQANVERISASKNHPSVIIWSLANECRWSPLWSRVNQVVKEIDPSRPTTFHDQCWGGFNNAGSKADIAVYHYPNELGPAKCDENTERPTLFGEYDHISCYNRRELVTDPGVRSAYGPILTQMYDSVYYNQGCLGGAIWSGIDDIFHMPDGRIVGYGPWGSIDGWRRPKPEYWGMKKAYSPVKVMNIGQVKVSDDKVRLQIENRYDFTNLNQIKVVATIDGKEQPVKANIAPRSSGIIELPVPPQSKELHISFMDPGGFITNEELIQLAPEASDVIADGTEELTISEKPLTYHIQSGNQRFIISKESGIITSAYINNEPVLEQGPVFGVVHMNRDNGGKPNVANSTYQNDIHPIKDYPFYTLFAKNLTIQKQDDGDILVNMEINYKEGSGEQTYRFMKNGVVEVSYKVRSGGGEIKPRQYGMIFQLPKTMAQISWERVGEFSTYTKDDISRSKGTASLNAKHLAIVEPIGENPKKFWKDEANDLGSKDFRATKSNIKWVKLQNEPGNGILIHSDGHQAARSWLQDERIQLLVADYNNAGAEPFYSGLYKEGRIEIEKDQVIEGGLKFSLEQMEK
jgi:hypothetical protein